MNVLKSRESLAVKYRPKRLEDLVGQDKVTALLQGQFRSRQGINRSFLVSGPTGCGKCIVGDSLILTKFGFSYIEDIIIPTDSEGFTRRHIPLCNRASKFEVTSHVFYEKASTTYKLTTLFNFQIEGTAEHKVLCFDPNLAQTCDSEVNWRRLDEIKPNEQVVICCGMQLWPDTSVPDAEQMARLAYDDAIDIIPNVILSADKESIRLYIRRYFAILKECDMALDYGYAQVFIMCEKLCRQIQTVLLNFNIVANIFPSETHLGMWCLSLSTHNLDNYLRQIVSGMNLSESDTSMPYFFDTVKSVECINEEKYVYDVTMPETHSFFANGFVNHNTTLARIIAHYVNCDNFNKESCTPCGVCQYCQDVDQGYYGGVDEINFSDTRGIDTIRTIIESTAYASMFNAHVFICDEIQSLTGPAQNAFLKTLEEPPAGVIFLLLTTDPQKLLKTIINRCCPITVKKVGVEEMSQYLLKVCQLDNRDYFTPKALPPAIEDAKLECAKAYAVFKNIAMFSNGYVRQGLAILEAVLSMIEGGAAFDPQDTDAIHKIVGQFVENPEIEVDILQFLICGLYSGRYGITLQLALKMVENMSMAKIVMERALDMHLQVLYFLVDPNKKLVGLTDPFYNRTYASVLDVVKQPNAFLLVHASAAEIVDVFMDLISNLGSFIHDERRLILASTLKMLATVHKYKDVAYTPASVFHKIHAQDVLKVGF